MAEYIFELNDALYDEKTGEACFKPTLKGKLVRCKDCKWFDILQLKKDGTGDMRFKPSLCTLYNQVQREDYYCADGERSEPTQTQHVQSVGSVGCVEEG